MLFGRPVLGQEESVVSLFRVEADEPHAFRPAPIPSRRGGRWSPSRRPGLATLKVGELKQMLVSAGGNVGSGASTRAVQTEAVAAWR